jgi:hypothetical protein
MTGTLEELARLELRTASVTRLKQLLTAGEGLTFQVVDELTGVRLFRVFRDEQDITEDVGRATRIRVKNHRGARVLYYGGPSGAVQMCMDITDRLSLTLFRLTVKVSGQSTASNDKAGDYRSETASVVLRPVDSSSPGSL